MASTNYYATGDTGVIDSYIECISNGSSSVTLKLFVRRSDSSASIDGTYNVSGAASASGSYVLSSSYTEIWSKTFNISASGGTASLNLSFTIKATSPSAGVKTVNGSLSEVYLDGGGSSGGGGNSSGGTSISSTYLWSYATPGVNLQIERTWAENPEAGGYEGKLSYDTQKEIDGLLFNGYKIWYKDHFAITATVLDGYVIDTHTANGYNFNFVSANLDYNAEHNNWGYWYQDGTEPWIYASATPKEYQLSVSKTAGANLTIKRISSDKQDASINVTLNNGDTIWHNDQLEITCYTDVGYDLSLSAGGTVISSGNIYSVSGNTTIVANASVKSYELTLKPDTGVKIAVNRTSSPLQGAANKTFESYEQEVTYTDIYYGDVLTITFIPDPGYKLYNQQVNEEYFISGSQHTVTGDIYVAAITELSGIVHIFDGASFNNYIIQIFNGSTWDQYIPYVFDGAKWSICS